MKLILHRVTLLQYCQVRNSKLNTASLPFSGSTKDIMPSGVCDLVHILRSSLSLLFTNIWNLFSISTMFYDVDIWIWTSVSIMYHLFGDIFINEFMGCLHMLTNISICKHMHSYCGHLILILWRYFRSHRSIDFADGHLKENKTSIKLLKLKAQYFKNVKKKKKKKLGFLWLVL